MDHRHGERHHTFTLVKVRCNNRDVPGLVYNCSRQGAFVLSTATMKKGQFIEILTEDSFGKKIVSISGLVVHQGKSGFGLLFCQPNGIARRFAKKITNRWAAGGADGVSAYG